MMRKIFSGPNNLWTLGRLWAARRSEDFEIKTLSLGFGFRASVECFIKKLNISRFTCRLTMEDLRDINIFSGVTEKQNLMSPRKTENMRDKLWHFNVDAKKIFLAMEKENSIVEISPNRRILIFNFITRNSDGISFANEKLRNFDYFETRKLNHRKRNKNINNVLIRTKLHAFDIYSTQKATIISVVSIAARRWAERSQRAALIFM